jgi:hypothetical protein
MKFHPRNAKRVALLSSPTAVREDAIISLLMVAGMEKPDVLWGVVVPPPEIVEDME